MSGAASNASNDPLIGQCLGEDGRFVLEERLGSGGMGTVYRARDRKREREVALKLFRRDDASQIDLERFRREGMRFGRLLRHPNIVRVHAFKASSSGRSFIVTELVEGRTLGQILHERGAFAIEDALRAGRDVASGLAFAHRAHIVHRDLKPSNVMIRSADRAAVILDFGIAKDLGSTMGITRLNSYVGTPGYSAPEQIRGGDVDERSDVFSLGALLFELVTGKFAFDGKVTEDVLGATLNADPPSASELDDRVPPELSALLGRMLQKSPRRRPAGMDEVLAEIESIRGSG